MPKNCAVVGCAVDSVRCKGLSFFCIRRPKNPEWENTLIRAINRTAFNVKYATICSRHFKKECLLPRGQEGLTLKMGSIPTEYMPRKSCETSVPCRKPPENLQKVMHTTLAMSADDDYSASVQKKPQGAHYCCVCNNWRGKIFSGTKVSLHRFPVDGKVRNVWIRRVKLAMVSDFVLTKNSRLCSRHFVGLAGPKPPKITIPSLFPNKTYQTITVQDLPEAIAGSRSRKQHKKSSSVETSEIQHQKSPQKELPAKRLRLVKESVGRQKQGVNLCSAANCLNVRNKSSCKGKSFFRFPKDEDRCKKWIQFCRREFPKHMSCLDLNKKYKICCDHFEDSQFNCPSERNSLVWNAVPTILNVANPPPKKSLTSSGSRGSNKQAVENIVSSCSDKCCDSCSMTESLPMVKEGLPYFLQEHNYAQFFSIVACIERSSGKRLYHRRRSLPTELVPGKSIVTPHCHSGKEPLDRKKQIEKERNGGCQTARTKSCPKSQKNRKRKLSKKVKSNRKGMELTNITCNDEHSDTEQHFIIKIEREDDYEETYVNSYLSSEAAAETVLEKQVKIEPDSISDDLFEMRSNSKESHGHSSHSAGILKLEQDSAYAEWPELTGMPDTGAATEMEVRIEPCSDIEEKPPVFFVSSNMAQNIYLADSNLIAEPVRTFVKSEIKSDPDDSEQTTTVYVCELCNECFYSHNQLLNHRENHTKIQIYL